jgi:predicted porin
MMYTPTLGRSLCAGLFLLAAMDARAQADYAALGVIDLSYGRFEPSGALREHRFNSNSLSASFVGVTAKYGLDNGWTPGVTLETFLRFQDLETGRNDRDPLLSRNAFVSLASNYGTLRVGRLQTYLFDTTIRFNAMGNSVAFSPAVRQVFLAGNLVGVQGDFYWNRAISYSTRTVDGVTGNLMYSQGTNDERGNLSAGSLVVSKNLFSASLSVQRVRRDDGIEDPVDEDTWQLGASYNFGLVRVFGLYTQLLDRGLDVRSKLSSAGLAVPVGPGTLQTQIGYAIADGPAVERKHTAISAAYLYPYDSVTDFYIAAMDDRVRGQTRGLSFAAGARFRFQ